VRWEASNPGVSLQIIPGAEHWMAWYLADTVAESIRGFMPERLDTTGFIPRGTSVSPKEKGMRAKILRLRVRTIT
jgi:hypothetical protein